MKYAIVFSSRTGNTQQLAEQIKAIIPKENCVYFGTPDEKALSADIIFAGFWTDKGDCDETEKAFLKTIKNKQVFLFGTAGFGGSAEYFDKILTAAKKDIDVTVTIIGEFMCQGKMPASVLERYKKMLAEADDKNRFQGMIDNFNSAMSHPDKVDFDNIKNVVNKIIKEK